MIAKDGAGVTTCSSLCVDIAFHGDYDRSVACDLHNLLDTAFDYTAFDITEVNSAQKSSLNDLIAP
jgi:hypothetical protein